MYELKLVLIHAGRWLPLMTAHKSFKKCLLVFTTSNQLQFSPIFFVSPLDLIRNGHQPKVVLIIAGRWLPLMTPHKSFSNSVFWTKNPTRRWLVLGGQPDWPLRWLPKSKNITTMLLRSMTLNFFLYTSHWWPVCKGYQKKCCKFCDTPFIRVEYTPTPNTVNFHWTVDNAFESEPKGFWSASTYFSAAASAASLPLPPPPPPSTTWLMDKSLPLDFYTENKLKISPSFFESPPDLMRKCMNSNSF